MKTIYIKQDETVYKLDSDYALDETWVFRCAHVNAEVEEACCSSVGSSGYIECGCEGVDSIYCPDCRNKDMTDKDAREIFIMNGIESEE